MTRIIADFSGIFIFSELSKAPCHGYQLRKTIRQKTGHLPNIGQIYPILYRYEKLGFLKSHFERNWRGQHIKVYELTEKGKKTAQQIKAIISTL